MSTPNYNIHKEMLEIPNERFSPLIIVRSVYRSRIIILMSTPRNAIIYDLSKTEHDNFPSCSIFMFPPYIYRWVVKRDWKDLTGGSRIHKDDIMQIGHVDL